jgi:hypothetical protein
MAALPPIAQLGGQPAAVAAANLLPGPQPSTYTELYANPAYDRFAGNYVNMYNEFAVGNALPLALRQAIYRDGNVGSPMHVLVHVRDPAADPDDPGLIVSYHRLTRRDTEFGHQAMPYDGQGLGFFGDIELGQAPATVVIPDAMFNQVGPVQVPNPGLLTQEFAQDPAAELVGPYQAGTADVQPVTTRSLMLVPNRYAALFLGAGMKPKDAYIALNGLIAQEGQQVACAPLLDWLRVALTKRAGQHGAPITMTNPLVPPVFVTPGHQQHFLAYRRNIVHTDFPHMQPGQLHNSAVLIADGITQLTAEQRLARQEAQQHRTDTAAPKTPKDYFGVLLERVMRWAQVGSELDLPPIYETLANTKKGNVRIVLQTAMEDALTNLKYLEDFPLSSTLATKMTGLKWYSPMAEDFTVGLNLFSFGSLEEENMEHQRRLNQHADAIAGSDAAPSLLDIATIQDVKQDVCIPKTFSQLRYLIERSEALWQVLLGSQHSVTLQHKAYRNMLITQEKRLERITPRDPSLKLMVPALMGRVVQLTINAWLGLQLRSAAPVACGDLLQVFTDIELGRQWDPLFPAGYLQTQSAPSVGPPLSISPTTTTVGSTITTPSAMVPSVGSAPSAPSTNNTAGQQSNAMVRNLAYNEAVFQPFKAKGIRARLLKDQIRARGVSYPVNSQGKNMCLTYHVTGLCNERCSVRADHTTHTEAEDEALRLWCVEHYHLTP